MRLSKLSGLLCGLMLCVGSFACQDNTAPTSTPHESQPTTPESNSATEVVSSAVTWGAEQTIDAPALPPVPTGSARTSGSTVVAFDGERFLAVWFEQRPGNAEGNGVYGTLLDTDGNVLTPAGFPIAINTGALTWNQLAVTSDGASWYVTWTAIRGNVFNRVGVYGALINDSDLNAIQTIPTTIASNLSNVAFPSVASNGNGFMVAFEADGGGENGLDVFYSRIGSNGIPIDNAPQNLTALAGRQARPSVAGTAGRYLFVWEAGNGASTAVVARSYQNGAFEAQPFQVVAFSSGALSRPSAACEQVTENSTVLWRCTVAWSDANASQDLYARALEIGTFGVVFRTDPVALAATPSTSIDVRVARANGENLFVWVDITNNVYDIQYGTADGQLSNFTSANATQSPERELLPAAARGPQTLMLAWANTGTTNIEGAVFDREGAPSSQVLNTMTNRQTDPVVARGVVDDANIDLVVWLDERAGNPGLYASRLTSTGGNLDPNGRAIATTNIQDNPTVCAVGSRALIVWREGTRTLKAMPVDLEAGQFATEQTLVTAVDRTYGQPSCDRLGDGALVVWRTVWDGNVQPDAISSVFIDLPTGQPSNAQEMLATGNSLGDPAAIANPTGFTAVWPGSGRSGLVGLNLTSSGAPSGETMPLIDGGSNQNVSGVYTANGLVVTWLDNVDEGDVKIAWFSPDLAMAVPNDGLAITNDNIIDQDPQIAALDQGHVAVVWSSGNETRALKGKELFVSSSGINPQPGFLLYPNADFGELEPAIASAGDGTLITVFSRFVPGQSANTNRVHARFGQFNRRPRATPDVGYTLDEDSVLRVLAQDGVLSNDDDLDGDTLRAELVSGAINGVLSLNTDGSFTYTPAANFNGSDTFTYRASDGELTSGPVMVTLTINAANDPPVASPDGAYITAEDTPLVVPVEASILLNDNDRDNDALVAVLVADVLYGTLELAEDGSFTYTPGAEFNGSDLFTYRASDGSGESNTVSVALTVTPVGDPPVAVPDEGYSVPEDQVLVISAAGGVLANDSDIDGGLLRATVVQNVSNGELAFAPDGSFIYTPDLNYFGTDTFTYKAFDLGNLESEEVTVTIAVESINDPPVAIGESYNGGEDTTLTIGTAFGLLNNDSDVDGSELRAILVLPPLHGALTLTESGAFTYTPEENFFGTDTFIYVARDEDMADSNIVEASIRIAGAADPPVAASDIYTTNAGIPLVIDADEGVLGNDRDPDASQLVAVLVTDVSSGTLALADNGSFTYTPNDGFIGSDMFVYKARDSGLGESLPTPVTLMVNDGTQAPTVEAGGPYSGDEGESVFVLAIGSDPNPNSNLTYAWDFDNDGQFDDATGALPRYSAGDGPDNVVVRVQVSDGNNQGIDTTTIEIDNKNPFIRTIQTAPPEPGESREVTFTAEVEDYEEDVLTFVWDFGDDTQTLTGTEVSHIYADGGNYTVTLTVTDDDSGRSTDTLIVDVEEVAPSWSDIIGPTTIDEGSAGAWTSTLSKALHDQTNWSITWGDGSAPTLGDVNTDVSSTTIEGAHIYQDNGTFTISFVANDDDSQEGEQTFEIEVENVAPELGNLKFETEKPEGSAFAFSITATDPGSDQLTYTWDFGDGSPLQAGASATHTFTENGMYEVTVVVSDDDGGSSEAQTMVAVSNAPPSVRSLNVPGSGNEGQSLQMMVSADDPAGTDDPLTYTWDFGDGSQEEVGTLVSHTYAQSGTYTVSITVEDDDGGRITTTAMIVIFNIAPTPDGIVLPGNVMEGIDIDLSATASDPGSDQLTYRWNFGDGSPEVQGQQVRYAWADNGNFTVTLTVTDQDGDSNTIETSVNVANSNPQIADIVGDFSAQEAQLSSFTGNASDPGDDTLTYTWDFGDGASIQSGVNRTQVSHTYAQDGIYTLTLTVTDEDGGSATTERQVNVGGEGPVITSLSGDTLGTEGAQFTFQGIAVEPGNDPITYFWDFGDGSAPQANIDLTEVSHIYDDDGQFTVTLTAQDDDASVSAQLLVVVNNGEPVIGEVVAPVEANEGTILNLTATATDPGGDADPLTYTWNFGDNSPQLMGEQVNYAFAENGTFTITLTVNDDEDGRTVWTQEIVVANVAPQIGMFQVPEAVEEGQELMASAEVTDPAGDNDPLTLSWNFGDGTPAQNGSAVTHVYPNNGDFVVTLTASDDDGGITIQTQNVTVSNAPPIITGLIGAREGTEGQTFNFQLQSSDPGVQDQLTYLWDFGDGTPEQVGSNLASISHVYTDDNEVDTYQLKVAVADGDGLAVEERFDITVTNSNPTIQMLTGDQAGNEGDTFQFAAGASDAAGARDPLTYRWDFGDGTEPVVGRDRVQVSHVYRNNGNFNATLTVSDDDGGQAVQSLSITVANVTPVLRIRTNELGIEGTPLTLRAQVTDPGDDVLTYTWSFGDGTPDIVANNRPEVSHSFADNGVFTITVQVSDQDGAMDEATITALIANAPPSIISQPSLFAFTNVAYLYNIEVDDPGDDTFTYALLDAPEGMELNDTTGTVSWLPTGDRNPSVQIRVLDDDGGIATQQWVITLNPPDRDNDGSPDSCEDRYSVSDDPNVQPLSGDDPCDGDQGVALCQNEPTLDNDADGVSNSQECLTGSNPLVSNGPSPPTVHTPPDGALVEESPVLLVVNNGTDPDDDPLVYTFQLYSDPGLGLGDLVFEESNIREQPDRTQLEVPVDLDENAFYWWRTQASDGQSQSPWSDVAMFQFSLINDPPTIPVPLAPIGTIDAIRPTFTVENSTDIEVDAISYIFVISTDTEPPELVLTSEQIPGQNGGQTSWTIPDEMPALVGGQNYLWQAQAVDEGGAASEQSAPTMFFITPGNTLPGPPMLLEPSNDAVVDDLENLVFRIGEALDNEGDPLTYTVRLATNAALIGVAELTERVTDENGELLIPFSEFGFDVGDEDTRYYWQALANDGDGDGEVAEATFIYSTENDPPSESVLTSPIDGALISTLTPELAWAEAVDPEGDAVVYNVELFGSEQLDTPIFSAQDLVFDDGAPTVTLDTELEDRMRYAWRVQAVDVNGAEGPWTEPLEMFMVALENRPPTAPALLSPEEGVVFLSGDLLAWVWESATDPEEQILSYTLSVVEEGGDTPIFMDDEPTDEGDGTWSVEAETLPEGAYRWSVVASDGENTTRSEERSFSVESGADVGMDADVGTIDSGDTSDGEDASTEDAAPDLPEDDSSIEPDLPETPMPAAGDNTVTTECGCRLHTSTPPTSPLWLLFAAFGVCVALRRRRSPTDEA